MIIRSRKLDGRRYVEISHNKGQQVEGPKLTSWYTDGTLFTLNFNMDDRRYILDLSREDARRLREQLNRAFESFIKGSST